MSCAAAVTSEIGAGFVLSRLDARKLGDRLNQSPRQRGGYLWAYDHRE
jgi:hypothetical protein